MKFGNNIESFNLFIVLNSKSIVTALGFFCPPYISYSAPNRSSNNLPAIGMASPVVQYNDETCGTLLVEGTREGENVCLRRCTIWAMPGPCLCRLQHSLQVSESPQFH